MLHTSCLLNGLLFQGQFTSLSERKPRARPTAHTDCAVLQDRRSIRPNVTGLEPPFRLGLGSSASTDFNNHRSHSRPPTSAPGALGWVLPYTAYTLQPL